MTLKVIDGEYQKGIWMHDRKAHTQEEIDFINAAFREAGQYDPRWLKLVWDVKVESQPELKRIK